MRPNCLTQAKIKRFSNFDKIDSADEGNEEHKDRNIEEFIEETLNNLDDKWFDLDENENVVQEVMEKLDWGAWSGGVQSLSKARPLEKVNYAAMRWKPASNIYYFLCGWTWETNLYDMQRSAYDLNALCLRIVKIAGQIPKYRWANDCIWIWLIICE